MRDQSITSIAIFLLIHIIRTTATGALYGLPVLNGPINPISPTFGMKNRAGDFVHPGIWHTHEDLERIRLGVLHQIEPWKSAYANFSNDPFSLVDVMALYQMNGPDSVIARGGSLSNYTGFADDVRAAYQNTIMWYITKSDAHWNKSSSILNAWGTNLTSIIGTDTSLLVGLVGDLMVNAAEIMRWEGGWVEEGAAAIGSNGFSNQLSWLFARQSIIIGQANYGMNGQHQGTAIICRYNYALYARQHDLCAGIYGNYDPNTGQGAETGRDQSHAQSALGWTAEAARVMQSQGTDMYSYGDKILLKAAEYTAKCNLFFDVPFDPKFYRCEAILVNGPWEAPSNISRGYQSSPAVWDILYYEYVVKRGLSAPYTTSIKNAIDSIRGGSRVKVMSGPNLDDNPGWGDLIWAYSRNFSTLSLPNATIWGGGSIGPNGMGNLNYQDAAGQPQMDD